MVITLCSTDVIWENKGENFKQLDSLLSSLDYKSDVIVFPEMFSTGFTMNTSLAEDMNGESIIWLKQTAEKYGTALVASVPFKEMGKEGEQSIYNRAFFVFPNGEYVYYDKRHLFRMGLENRFYLPGNERTIVEYLGVRFAINICYDLRFPVWSRNVENEYDVLINVANFPISRLQVIDPLVRARAIENMAYVAFVNRAGKDPECEYAPCSLFVDYKGNKTGEERWLHNPFSSEKNGIQIIKGEIDLEPLKKFREKFPAWNDADHFTITI